MFTDFVINGQGHGSVGSGLEEVRFEPGLLRQFRDKRGRQLCTINTGEFDTDGRPVRKTFETRYLRGLGMEVPFVANATTMTQDWYARTDAAVVKATRERLRAWTDLAGANSVGGFNGMGTLQYQYNASNDPGEAVVDMDAVVDARNDTPLFKLRAVPLPITHSDFMYTERQLAASRGGSMAFDTAMAEAAARRVAETVEKTLIGIETGMTFATRSGDPLTAHDGTSTIYGYTNFPYRVTKTDLTTPTGANPDVVMGEVLDMVETMQANGFYGPYMLYHSTGYSRFFNDDYFRNGGTSAVRSLRERIMEIEGITDIRRLDYLTTGFQFILVQMTPEVAQAINGMEITTVQWPSQGGMRHNFKVMCIKVPLLKAPYDGVAGIIHATQA